MANIGTAIAQGIAQGVGQGANKYYDDQRRTKRSKQDMANAFTTFKQQQDYSNSQRVEREKNMAVYSTNLSSIDNKNKATETWKANAQLSPSDLAFQIATKQSSHFAKGDRPKFFRDTMKRLNGMSKTELMAKAGYVLPDYSEFIDKPEYHDAIPIPTIGDSPNLPAASATFKYDPRVLAGVQQQKAEKVSAYMEKRNDEYKAIDSMGMVTYGATMDESVKNLIWKNRPEGKGVEMQGAEAVSYDQTFVNALIKAGKVIQVGTQLRLTKEVEIEDKALSQRTKSFIPTSEGDTASLYTEPKAQEQITRKLEKEQVATKKAAVKRVEDKQGKVIKSYESLDTLKEGLASLSPDAKEILFGGSSAKGILSISDLAQQIAAKGDVKGAKESRKFLSLMENISATLKHEQYGSAQTATELKNFAAQLGNPSVFQNPDTLLSQIETRKKLVRDGVEAGVGVEDRQAYLESHPEAEGLFGTKQTVSDSSDIDVTSLIESAPEESRDELKQALEQGATASEIAEYIQYLKEQQ